MKKLGLVLGTLILAACGSGAGTNSATAQQLANQLFGAATRGTSAPAESYGSYARGCADGLVELPETGPTWQAMRLSRNRNWGHPETIDYIQDLSRQAVAIGWNGLYVGDISQPRGGPMTSGHASHQLGLDVDIWMLPPGSLTLSRTERENISSISVRTEDQRGVTSHWTAQHAALLRAAASDPRVDRVFVAAAVKIEMCRTATPADTAWLQRIRPIAGHNYHFHVRLRCPAGSRHCETQTPSVAELSNGGNGCDDTLTWWVTDYLNPPRRTTPVEPSPEPPQPRRRSAREMIMADLPRQCAQVLERE
ncbi:penicillin-insensitive murein endopeptidase [Pararhodobacter sp.]|uniref:penicillin-insensitive murein endopeptidase n=1 Tax=Pararhodobacter sp. TaxID=2127056 RepID=UPI002FE21628|nr:penicillin-insensitive murein endopeptidase [Pseudomonadota bacterium]